MTDEIRYSLASTLVIKCPFCGKSNQVKTSGQHRSGKFGPPAFDINTQVLPGCLHASIGQTRINNVLSTLNAPTLNPVTFKLREREVGKAVESVAKSSCQNCSTMEKNKAPQNGVKSDEGNLIPIPCSFEMGWQRRGMGYNSRTGQAAVMSLSSGKVLDYTTRAKSCRFRDWVKSTGKQPKARDCRKKPIASSKAMEPDAAVELFNKAPTQGVKFSIYTGDDDSTTEAHMRQKVGYHVEKFSDIVHMKTSLTTHLYNLNKKCKI